MTATNGEKRCLPTVVIKGRYYGDKTLPSLNDAINEYARHPKAGGKMKNDCKWICIAAIRSCLKGLKVENPPIVLHYKFYEPTKGQRRDFLNVFDWADKCFEDALQDCGTIKNDNPDWVVNATHEFFYTSGEPYIEITIEERGNKNAESTEEVTVG